MASGQVTITGTVTGMLSGSKTIGPIVVTDSAASVMTFETVLSSGFNTINVPTATSCSGVLICFAAASTLAKTLKGVTGDTGVALNPNGVNFISFNPASPPASFGITTTAADTSNVTEILFL